MAKRSARRGRGDAVVCGHDPARYAIVVEAQQHRLLQTGRGEAVAQAGFLLQVAADAHQGCLSTHDGAAHRPDAPDTSGATAGDVALLAQEDQSVTVDRIGPATPQEAMDAPGNGQDLLGIAFEVGMYGGHGGHREGVMNQAWLTPGIATAVPPRP